MQEKTLDVVVYGATGYTGKLVVEYLLNQYGKGEDFYIELSSSLRYSNTHRLVGIIDK